MTRIKHLEYSAFELSRVHMEAGDRFLITADAARKSVGLVCVLGGAAHAAQPAPALHLPQAGEGLFLNDPATGWENNDAVHLQADVETEWLCVSVGGSGRRPALELATVQGDSALGAGTGVIVVDGEISLDGVTGGPDAYFRPRPAVVTLSGAGQVILVGWR